MYLCYSLFSSPEFKVLKVSYCDQPKSGVRCLCSHFHLNMSFETTYHDYAGEGEVLEYCSNCSGWLQDQKMGYKMHKKNLAWNHKAQNNLPSFSTKVVKNMTIWSKLAPLYGVTSLYRQICYWPILLTLQYLMKHRNDPSVNIYQNSLNGDAWLDN